MEDTQKKKYRELIDSYFDNGNKYSKYSFRGMMENTIANVVERFFHIIVFYFDKYSEDEFHRRMENKYILVDKKTGTRFICEGFDFIDDFKKFHKAKFIASMMAVKSNKHWFKFDEPKMIHILIGLLETKGWQIYDHERVSITQTVRRFKNIIYHSRDTLEDIDHNN